MKGCFWFACLFENRKIKERSFQTAISPLESDPENLPIRPQPKRRKLEDAGQQKTDLFLFFSNMFCSNSEKLRTLSLSTVSRTKGLEVTVITSHQTLYTLLQQIPAEAWIPNVNVFNNISVWICCCEKGFIHWHKPPPHHCALVFSIMSSAGRSTARECVGEWVSECLWKIDVPCMNDATCFLLHFIDRRQAGVKSMCRVCVCVCPLRTEKST